MKTLSERLKFLRKKRGLESKSIAANALDIKYGTYQRYEYGSVPNRKNYNKISDYYGCSLSWLITGDGEPFPAAIKNYPEPEPVKPLILKEGGASYSPAPASSPEIRISEALQATARVLESGTTYATALYLNIQHFDRAITAEASTSQLGNQIKALNDKCASFDGKLDEMEKRLEKVLGENRSLNTENNRLKATYENPDGIDGSDATDLKAS